MLKNLTIGLSNPTATTFSFGEIARLVQYGVCGMRYSTTGTWEEVILAIRSYFRLLVKSIREGGHDVLP